jgi:DNA-binding GntR family transcriptional regulator
VPRDGHKANGGAPAPALTDQAIIKIKDLILTGEFQAGSKLSREQDLAQKLGLSRNSLREAVRALALIGVLDTRVGDGTYVTSLDAELLMTDFAELADILERMERADRTQAFIDADNDFHRVINSAAANATLASLIQNLSGGMVRARLWPTATEQEAVDITKRDVRRARVAAGETVVVIGGGPIGVMISLVARSRGARVIVSEVNASRLAFARHLGLMAVNPGESGLAQVVEDVTAGAGADVVFEVSGSAGGAMAMTKLAGLRGRVVVVAIFCVPLTVSLFDVFRKELEVLGTRVYEPEDYESAIDLLVGGRLPLADLITSVEPLEQLPAALEQLERSRSAMKILVDCRA